MSYENFNTLIPKHYRSRLNSQKNKMKLEAEYDSNGKITQPYLYVIGLGEKHFRNFNREILRIENDFHWLKAKHFRFVMNELIVNSQFSMLREAVNKIPKKRKVAGYFFVKIYPCADFVSVSIEEFGDQFDYIKLISHPKLSDKTIEELSDFSEQVLIHDMNNLAHDKTKISLSTEDTLHIPDSSNKIGLNIIENATDHDFYITSFYKNKKYMWKRIYFRIENCQ